MKLTNLIAAAVLAAAIPLGAAAQTACGASIFFASGSSRLTAQMRQGIDNLLAANPGQPMTIIGYADPVGSAALNQRLSTARAQAVAAYVRQRSPNTPVNQVQGAGEVAASGGPDAQARRVEVRLPRCSSVVRAPGMGDMGAIAGPEPTE